MRRERERGMKYEPESENGRFIKQQMKFKLDVFLIVSLREDGQ